MKLRQNGTVFRLLNWSLWQPAGTANRRITNIEPQNVEGWNRFAQSFFKIDRIHYFDIRHSLFDIRYSLFQSFFSDQTGRFSGQRRRSYETVKFLFRFDWFYGEDRISLITVGWELSNPKR
jgi:hypothetical protein